MQPATGACRLPRIGARRPRSEDAEAELRRQQPLRVPGIVGTGDGPAPRRTPSNPAALLMAAALPAALLLLAAAPVCRAFLPPACQQQPPRQRPRPHATVTPEMYGSTPSQPGGSSPTSPGGIATSPSAALASLASPPAPGAAATGNTARRRSRLDPALSLETGPLFDTAGEARTPRPQDQHCHHHDVVQGGPLAQVLVEELPGISLAAAMEKAPRLFQAAPAVEAGACRRRLQALKGALPGGVNVTHAVLEVPRLVSYYGREAAAMEAAVGPRFRALCEATGTSADAAEIVNRWPRVLLRDFDLRVRPHLEALGELLPGCDAAYLLRKHPAVLSKSVAAYLRPRIQEHLPALFPAALGLGAAVAGEQEGEGDGHQAVGLGALAVTYPELLTAPLDQLQVRVEALSKLLPPELLLPTLSLHARAWTADLGDEVGPQVRLLRARLGEETAGAVLLNLPSAMYHTPAALEKRLDVLEALLGPNAHAVLALNPMILAVDAAAHVAPKVRYLRALFDPELVDDARFNGMLATEAGAKCLTSAFGRLGRLSYLLQVQPSLDLAAGLKLCVTSSEELRRRYPGYENFLEDRIEPRFPNYTWEQLCALPFAMREQAHGEILHTLYSIPAGEDGDEEGGGGGFFEPIDPLALLDDEAGGAFER